jgi:hypothetical protein
VFVCARNDTAQSKITITMDCCIISDVVGLMWTFDEPSARMSAFDLSRHPLVCVDREMTASYFGLSWSIDGRISPSYLSAVQSSACQILKLSSPNSVKNAPVSAASKAALTEQSPLSKASQPIVAVQRTGYRQQDVAGLQQPREPAGLS